MWVALREFGVPQHLIWLVKNLYDNATGMIRLEDRKSDPFRFEKGVRQGCLFSPLLFNTVGEYIMRRVDSNMPTERLGKIIGGRAVWNIRYADDTTLVGTTKERVDNLAEQLRRARLDI